MDHRNVLFSELYQTFQYSSRSRNRVESVYKTILSAKKITWRIYIYQNIRKPHYSNIIRISTQDHNNESRYMYIIQNIEQDLCDKQIRL